MTSAVAVVQAAMRFAGWRYVLGAKGTGGAIDCSGLTWAALAEVGVDAPHGTVNQFPWCQRAGKVVSVAEAVATPGAGLFVYLGANRGGGRGNHVAISRGDGTTIEARSARTRPQVGVHTAHGRGWTHGVLWPGVAYSGGTDDMTPEQDRMLRQVHRAIFTGLNPDADHIGYAVLATNYTVQNSLTVDGKQPFLPGQLRPSPPVDVAALVKALAPMLIDAMKREGPLELSVIEAAVTAALSKVRFSAA